VAPTSESASCSSGSFRAILDLAESAVTEVNRLVEQLGIDVQIDYDPAVLLADRSGDETGCGADLDAVAGLEIRRLG
jgi:hypothetical protein